MQIWIGASDNKQLVDAQRWVADKASRRFVQNLESWALSKESEWGECYIFIETFLPQGKRFTGTHNQVDLLICFSSIAALCELKGYAEAMSVEELRRTVNQIRGQRDWITDLTHGKREERNIYPFLFLHRMFPHNVKLTAKRLIDVFGAMEIWPVGGHDKLRGERLSIRPLYLTEALEDRLSKNPHPSAMASYGLQQLLHTEIVKNESTVLPFANFEDAKNF